MHNPQPEHPDDAQCPKVTVSPKEFTDRAKAAGWKPETVRVFLTEPRLCKFIRVGDEMLLVK